MKKIRLIFLFLFVVKVKEIQKMYILDKKDKIRLFYFFHH